MFRLCCGKSLYWWRGLDPVVITRDSFDFDSVARLHVFFFTLIVVSPLTCVFLRTGYLSEISENILSLGITGVGSTASRSRHEMGQADGERTGVRCF